MGAQRAVAPNPLSSSSGSVQQSEMKLKTAASRLRNREEAHGDPAVSPDSNFMEQKQKKLMHIATSTSRCKIHSSSGFCY